MRFLFPASFALSVLIVCSCSQSESSESSSAKAKPTTAIAESVAIELAEQYVYEKGYTSKTPPNLTFENANLGTDEFASNLEGVLKLRKNQLEPKALEARLYKKKTRWAVGFEYINKEDNIGRCVSMDTLGNDIKVLEGQLRLDWLYIDQPEAVKYTEE